MVRPHHSMAWPFWIQSFTGPTQFRTEINGARPFAQSIAAKDNGVMAL